MKFIYQTMCLLAIIFCLTSCEKYLDVKPDKKQVIPTSLADCQAILNDNGILGSAYPRSGEIASDDFTLTFPVWNGLQSADKEAYVWQSDANILYVNWFTPYRAILYANQVLETLEKITPTTTEQVQWNRLKGGALLVRAIYFYSLAQIFTKPYDVATAGQDLGIPLRLSPSLSEVAGRGTVQQTYDRIIQDLTEAAALLPAEQLAAVETRTTSKPVKAAAFAALARVYLTMGDYTNAFNNADASLKQYNILMDYNTLNASPRFPIPNYNVEVIYDISTVGNIPLFSGRVVQSLYDSYASNDLRKSVCFHPMETGTYVYKGTYSRGQLSPCLATDEVYLIRAECAARAGNAVAAMKDLNDLLRTRWKFDVLTNKSLYIDQTAASGDAALSLVLAERRKELPFRGLRWTDLRRLNKDSRFAVTLTRNLNGQTYTLPPNDLRYTFLIPREVLEREAFPQNPR